MKLVTVMMCSGFRLKCRAKKRRLTLVAFLGFFTLAFYLHSRRNKDTASHITRIKSSAGTLSNILRLRYCNILAFGVYILTRAFYLISYPCVMHVFLVRCYICKPNVLLGFNWLFELFWPRFSFLYAFSYHIKNTDELKVLFSGLNWFAGLFS